MSIHQIIEEELAEAKRRIQGRVHAFLVGGGVGRPFLPPDKKVSALSDGGKLSKREVEELAEKALGYIKENPGSYIGEICKAVGIRDDDRSLRWRLKERLRPSVIIKGSANKTVYFFKEGRGASKAKAESKGRSSNNERFTLPPGPARQKLINDLAQRALAFIRQHPGANSQTVGGTLQPSTVHERHEAYKLLIAQGLVRAEDNGPMSKFYFPILKAQE